MATPPLIVESTIRFLRAHLPFSRMARVDLEFIAVHARLGYFPVGSTIVDPAAGIPDYLHIIQRGHVRVRNPNAATDDEVRGVGECFPVAALAADAAGTRTFEATEDVFVLLLPRADFEALRQRSPEFAQFCAKAMATVLHHSLGQLRNHFSQRATDQQTLLEPLKALVRRDPVYCAEDTSIRQALECMSDQGVRTIAVVDAQQRPLGVFTLLDLMERVVLPGMVLDTPVAEAMTRHPAMLDELCTAQEGLALMASQGFHQLLVVRGGELSGIVTERDLFGLQRVTLRNITQTVRLARDVPALQRVVGDIAVLTGNLVAQGAAAEPLTHTITALNDALTQRLFELLLPSFQLDDVSWCWLAVGSEGRREQTVATDQDNVIVFECDPAMLVETRARLLIFAREANTRLAELGFPLCSGNIMAGNPDCCLSLDEWCARFASWIREPTPQALLAANIYFDFRPLAGNHQLAGRLRAWLDATSSENKLFLRMLVANALQAEPPLGWIRTFRTDEGEFAGTLDLKTHGTRIFVDAARAFALALGLGETNTSQRIRMAGRRLNRDEREITASVDAYHFLQLLRLRAQRGGLDVAPDESGGQGTERSRHGQNRLDPYALNEIDQRMLREAFRQARSLQTHLEQVVGH
jgi:CBS domain-containing protein